MSDHSEMVSKALDIMATAMHENMANLHLSDREYFRNDAFVALAALGAAGFKLFAPDGTQGQFYIGNLTEKSE